MDFKCPAEDQVQENVDHRINVEKSKGEHGLQRRWLRCENKQKTNSDWLKVTPKSQAEVNNRLRHKTR